MAYYNIYFGIGGNMQYQYTREYNSVEEAEDEAREGALDEYRSYEGYHGVLSWDDCQDEYCEENNYKVSELSSQDIDAIDNMYREEVESSICYNAILTEKDDIPMEMIEVS